MGGGGRDLLSLLSGNLWLVQRPCSHQACPNHCYTQSHPRSLPVFHITGTRGPQAWDVGYQPWGYATISKPCNTFQCFSSVQVWTPPVHYHPQTMQHDTSVLFRCASSDSSYAWCYLFVWSPQTQPDCMAHSEDHFPAPSSNSATFGYATEGALFLSAQLSTNAVSTLQKNWVLI